ncbi:MAG TPA: septum formation family protein [Acidimicrobiia bacterium]|nr:septum formation family protein [Acidimicrobiia bacterium]
MREHRYRIRRSLRAKAHEWEIAGYVDLTSNLRPPPAVNDVAGWQRLVGDRCRVVGRGYLGHDPIDDQGASWLPIEPGSWAAGRRTVECVVARFRADHTVASVGSLKG